MKLYRLPYYLILVFAASAAMIFFWKINKKSFYNHYFKGIADIELRNSQAMGVDSSIEVFALVDLKPVVLSLFWLGISLLLGLLIPRLVISSGFVASIDPKPHTSFYKMVYATRAP